MRPSRLLWLSSLTLLLLTPPAALAGQEGEPPDKEGLDWFPGRSSFSPLMVAPREVTLRGGFILADRPDLEPSSGSEERARDFDGTNIEAEVAAGYRIPVLRLTEEGPGRPEITLGFEVGVFTRFFLESPEKDLINADFRVGGPVSVAYRGWEARLTLRHESSHFGDDFVNRFDPPRATVTQDGFELLIGRRLAGDLRLYGGGDVNFNVNPGVERTAARWGIEFDPRPTYLRRRGPGAGSGAKRPSDGGGTAASEAQDDEPERGFALWPYGAADFEATSSAEEVAFTGAAGVSLWIEGVTLQLEARGHFGPSPMGRFRNTDENFGGIGLTVIP